MSIQSMEAHHCLNTDIPRARLFNSQLVLDSKHYIPTIDLHNGMPLQEEEIWN